MTRFKEVVSRRAVTSVNGTDFTEGDRVGVLGPRCGQDPGTQAISKFDVLNLLL